MAASASSSRKQGSQLPAFRKAKALLKNIQGQMYDHANHSTVMDLIAAHLGALEAEVKSLPSKAETPSKTPKVQRKGRTLTRLVAPPALC